MPRTSVEAVEVIPFVALSPGARHLFTYGVPAGMTCRVGMTVRVPFGPRRITGVVWRVNTRVVQRMKNIDRIIGGPFFTDRDRTWIETLAETSLESLAMLVKALVSVRAPLKALPDQLASTERKRSRRHGVHVSWRNDVRSLLERGKREQVLAFVPELIVGAQVAEQCAAHGIPVQQFSQGMRITERRRALAAMMAGEPGVVVATHAGTFLPFATLASIVVIEAALPSHRQWDLHPRYDARIAALLRARAENIPVTFQSTLPSADLTAITGAEAAANALPALQTAVISKPFDDASLLLPETSSAIRRALDNQGHVFLFQDVIGTERAYACFHCGYRFRCQVCGGMVERKNGNLVCRQCSAIAGPVRNFCPRCSSPNIRPERVGTRALETAVSRQFPGIPIHRLDRETIQRGKPSAVTPSTGPSIAIGTERAFAVLSGAPFSLSVAVDADGLLTSPLYDAGERALSLIQRLANLTVEPHRTTVMLQTSLAKTPLLHALAEGTTTEWLARDSEERTETHFPPFASMIRLTKSFPAEQAAERATRAVVDTIRRHAANVHVGWRIPQDVHGFRGDIIIRGHRADLWRVLPRLPRTWTYDPFVPLRDLV